MILTTLLVTGTGVYSSVQAVTTPDSSESSAISSTSSSERPSSESSQIESSSQTQIPSSSSQERPDNSQSSQRPQPPQPPARPSESESRQPSSSAQSSVQESSSEPSSSQAQNSRESVESSEPSSTLESSSSQPSSSSTAASSSSVKTYSKKELLDYLYRVYPSWSEKIGNENKERLKTNNDNGAGELHDAYRDSLKNIKSGKTTHEEREALVSTQKAALQQALSRRLASLQAKYDQDIKVVKAQLDKLPGDHQHDGDAVALNDKLTQLDYDLGHQSNKAYTRYNKAVAKLNKQAASAKVKSKKQQRQEAKETYHANLRAVGATDPKDLKQQNKDRLKTLGDNYDQVKNQIKQGEISEPNEIESGLGHNLE